MIIPCHPYYFKFSPSFSQILDFHNFNLIIFKKKLWLWVKVNHVCCSALLISKASFEKKKNRMSEICKHFGDWNDNKLREIQVSKISTCNCYRDQSHKNALKLAPYAVKLFRKISKIFIICKIVHPHFVRDDGFVKDIIFIKVFSERSLQIHFLR